MRQNVSGLAMTSCCHGAAAFDKRDAESICVASIVAETRNAIAKLPLVDEADDVLHGLDGFGGNDPGALTAIDQNLIDIGQIGCR